MLNRKAIVSFNTFALLLMIYLAIFMTSYYFYNNFKDDSISNLKEKECLNSALSFRSSVIDVIKYPNSSLIYVYDYTNDNMLLSVENNTIIAREDINFKMVEVNISSLGINFCSNYNFSQSDDVQINYNGSCVSILN